MLARNATIKQFSGITIGTLETAVKSRLFAPCGASDAISIGFVPPTEGQESLFKYVDGNIFYIKMRVDSKVLPASAVREEAKIRAKNFEEVNGIIVGRKLMKQIKEEVIISLLAKAFASTVYVGAWFDFKSGLLVIDTPSANKADQLVNLLIRSMAGTAPTFKLWVTNFRPESIYTQWIEHETIHPSFTIDDKALLSNENGGTIRINNQSIGDDENIQRLVMEGRVCKELALTFDGKLSFVLTKDLVLKKLDYIGIEAIQQDQAEMLDEERCDAEIILSASMVREAFLAISEAMGGLVEKESEAA